MLIWAPNSLSAIGVDKVFMAGCHRVIDPLPDRWLVTSGFRAPETQAKLYAQGRTTPGPIVTNAPAGHSAHEHGLAIDVGLVLGLSDAPTWDLSNPAWQRLWDAIRASPDLHSGQDFPPVAPADPDHIEARRWAYETYPGGIRQESVRSSLEAQGQW